MMQQAMKQAMKQVMKQAMKNNYSAHRHGYWRENANEKRYYGKIVAER